MTDNIWTRWPSEESLGREGISGRRRLLTWAVRLLVFAKTGIKDRAQAVRYVYGKGIVRPPGG